MVPIPELRQKTLNKLKTNPSDQVEHECAELQENNMETLGWFIACLVLLFLVTLTALSWLLLPFI